MENFVENVLKSERKLWITKMLLKQRNSYMRTDAIPTPSHIVKPGQLEHTADCTGLHQIMQHRKSYGKMGENRRNRAHYYTITPHMGGMFTLL